MTRAIAKQIVYYLERWKFYVKDKHYALDEINHLIDKIKKEFTLKDKPKFL